MNFKINLEHYKRAFGNFYIIFKILNYRVRFWVLLLLICLILTSISELVGLVSLIPLINILNNKNFIYRGFLGDYISFISTNTGMTSEMALTITTVILILIAYLARITSNFYTLKLSNIIGLSLHNQALKSFLGLSYSDQNRKLSDNLAHCLSNQVHQVVSGYIFPLLNVMSSLFVVFALGSALFLFSPSVTISIIFFTSFFYVIFGLIFLDDLSKGGKRDNISQNQHLLLVSNIKSFKKQIKLYSLEKFIYNKLSNFQVSIRDFHTYKNFISTLTRPLLELFILIGFAIFIFFISFQNNSGDKLTELIFIIIVSQKLFPVFQSIYAANTNIIANSSAIEEVIDYCSRKQSKAKTKPIVKYDLLDKVLLKDVDFKYKNEDKKLIFNSFNYAFNFGESYLIKAPSGFGKSTLIDLILGLLKPNKGKVLYIAKNKKYISSNFSKVEFISFVPQSNFFLDGKLRFLLTYNYHGKDFTDQEIFNACKIACIDKLIKELPNGLSTYFSNNISQLSGGQKQRLGIAQALLNPNIRLLIMDETLSNLDKPLAKKILDNIKFNFPDLSIIMVTHDETIIPNYFKIVDLTKLI